MSFVDVQVPQLVSSEASFGDQSALMRSTMGSAEQQALAAQAFNMGDMSMSFQAAHARFVTAAGKINALLDVAQANLGEGASTYVAQDSMAAGDVAAAGGALDA
jgi:uncharacterized protein YukE